jgi:hypothetical protein
VLVTDGHVMGLGMRVDTDIHLWFAALRGGIQRTFGFGGARPADCQSIQYGDDGQNQSEMAAGPATPRSLGRPTDRQVMSGSPGQFFSGAGFPCPPGTRPSANPEWFRPRCSGGLWDRVGRVRARGGLDGHRPTGCRGGSVRGGTRCFPVPGVTDQKRAGLAPKWASSLSISNASSHFGPAPDGVRDTRIGSGGLPVGVDTGIVPGLGHEEPPGHRSGCCVGQPRAGWPRPDSCRSCPACPSAVGPHAEAVLSFLNPVSSMTHASGSIASTAIASNRRRTRSTFHGGRGHEVLMMIHARRSAIGCAMVVGFRKRQVISNARQGWAHENGEKTVCGSSSLTIGASNSISRAARCAG